MPDRDRLSVTFSALADPTRRDILARLRDRPCTVSELAEHYPMSRAAVSQHLGVLERAGLVSRSRRGQWVDCSLSPDALNEVSEWIQTQRKEWNERLDRLELYLDTQNHPPPEAPTQKGEEP